MLLVFENDQKQDLLAFIHCPPVLSCCTYTYTNSMGGMAFTFFLC